MQTAAHRSIDGSQKALASIFAIGAALRGADRGAADAQKVGRRSAKGYIGSHDISAEARNTMNDMAAHLEAIGTARDKAAFEEVFRFYAPRIKGVLVRNGAGPQEAEEVMQETMVLIWRKAAQFDRSKASPSAWIYTIARNRRIDLLRKRQRPELDPEDPFFADSGVTPDGEETYGARQRGEIIEEHLKILPPEQLLLVQKAFYEDMTHQAIAAELDIPLGTVKSRLRIALRDLRAKLSGVDL